MGIVIGMSWPPLLLFSFSGIFVLLILHAYRQRETFGRKWFVSFLIANTLWLITYGIQLLVADPDLHFLLLGLSSTFGYSMVVLSVFFWLQVAGEGGFVRPSTVIPSLAFPVVAGAMFMTARSNGLVFDSYEWNHVAGLTTLSPTYGVGGLVLNGGLLLFALTSGAVLVWTFYRHWELYRSHAPWIVLLYVVTLGALGAYEAGYSPVDGMRLVPFTAPFQALVYGNVLFRYDLPDVSFRTRRIGLQEAMQTLEDGILIVDEDWRILEFNPIVRETFGGPSQLVGTGLADVVGDACVDSLQSGDTELLSPSPAKRMEATATPITEGDAVIGHIVLLRDVTALKAREQRLSVLNRVVRHNVRNEMTVVRGNSEVLEERLNGEDADIAANIRSAADDVVELGNKARQLESVLDSADQTAPVHVTRLGREVVSDVAAQYPDVAFSITGKEAVIHTNPDVLRTVIETLVENGAQHNDAAAPEVEVTVEHTGRDLTVTISDNGPGIPAVELDAFGGIETDLEHGMGLGLRLVQWGIEKLDGSVTFATDDGTTATITVPADDPDTAVQETASA